ncbi:unnamed protein product [Pedinophyceae sp. YPF-701]|nr:unnamed protein product [Pedinophyceae sp. YPF-701]
MERQKQFQEAGQAIERDRIKGMTENLAKFREALESFVAQHSDEIRSNAAFRGHFHALCAHAGVDPLASRKTAWSKLLGLGDYYYELGLQIIEFCLATRPLNGGLVALDDVLAALRRRRGRAARDEVGKEDVRLALRRLRELHGGYEVTAIGGREFLRSVPEGVSADLTAAIDSCREDGYTSVAALCRELGWEEYRAEDVLRATLRDGLAMLDEGAPDGERLYWFPSLFPGLQVGGGG